jgi:hypothetical protein
MAPIVPKQSEYDRLDDWVNGAINFVGLVCNSGTALDEDSLLVDAISQELAEGGANEYKRTNCTPSPFPTVISFNVGNDRHETGQEQFSTVIPNGQNWEYTATAVIRNGALWANRVVSAVDTGANTISFANNSGAGDLAGVSTGDRVCFTSSGTLPGGISANTLYKLTGVSLNTGTVTAGLSTLADVAVDITSAGSGTILVRAANGQAVTFNPEPALQNASTEFRFAVKHYSKRGTAP